eukprot:TRINITY_DN4079_c0_g1_i4.p2 TRINITY_DN4079_c0_g1~~TRINITY_DN4079_c0_g1_i4.p2  ORF type:complete len:120 (-),score=33.73 TRINITY_DN4079_c0_g1_i4:10-369(-)
MTLVDENLVDLMVVLVVDLTVVLVVDLTVVLVVDLTVVLVVDLTGLVDKVNSEDRVEVTVLDDLEITLEDLEITLEDLEITLVEILGLVLDRAGKVRVEEIGRAVQQECRDRSRMPSSA